MSVKTLPSPRVYAVDVPEVTEFSADFIYNFFEPDERTNDTGNVAPEFIANKPTTNFDSEFLLSRQLNRVTSRYVRFSWKPVISKQQKTINPNVNIKNNLQKIHEEQDFLARNFSSMTFNEPNRNAYIEVLVEQLKDQMGVNSELDFENLSSMDLVKFFKGNINQTLDENIIADILNDKEKNGQIFLNRFGKISEKKILENLGKVRTSMAINKKFLADALSTISETGHNLFQEQTDELLEQAREIQNEQQRSVPSTLIDAEDYDFEIVEFVDYKPVEPDGYKPQKQFLGYVIDKYELDDFGNRVSKESIVVENPFTSTTIDFKIKYGVKYAYSIKTVTLIESLVEDVSEENGQFVLLQYLLASKPSHEVHIECIENTPPPPPADFNVRWDANKQNLVLHWNFPTNSQRDIKYWQIFRREDIYEPFELQKVYDFNDSVTVNQDEYGEYPDELLVEKLSSPLNLYIDKSFQKDSVYMYAICSIDAHGLSSNYSTQFWVSFDSAKNKLTKGLISISGAPKAYPNMLIDKDLLVDTMKTSNARRMKIIFTPEYLNLKNSDNNDLGLIKTNKTDVNSYYKINLINVDLQEQENIEIKINDKRKSKKPSRPEPTKLLPPLRFGLRRRF